MGIVFAYTLFSQTQTNPERNDSIFRLVRALLDFTLQSYFVSKPRLFLLSRATQIFDGIDLASCDFVEVDIGGVAAALQGGLALAGGELFPIKICKNQVSCCHTKSNSAKIRGVSNQVNPMALAADTKAWLHCCVKLSVLWPKWAIGSDGDGGCDRLPESFTWVIFQLVSLASSRSSWKRYFFVHCRSTHRLFAFPFLMLVSYSLFDCIALDYSIFDPCDCAIHMTHMAVCIFCQLGTLITPLKVLDSLSLHSTSLGSCNS